MTLKVYTVAHWKTLIHGRDGSRGLSCGSTFSICQDALKIDTLLHKWGFVDSQMKTTIPFSSLNPVASLMMPLIMSLTIILTDFLKGYSL